MSNAVKNTNEAVKNENLVVVNKALTGKGNLVADNEAKPANNTQVINNRICFNLEVKNEETGEVEQVTQFVKITLWRNSKNSEMFDKFAQAKKGAFVDVEGALDFKPTMKNGKIFLNEFCMLSTAKQILKKAENVANVEQATNKSTAKQLATKQQPTNTKKSA